MDNPGRPERSERRTTADLLKDLAALADESRRLGLAPDPRDYETGHTTDDLAERRRAP